MAQQIVNIGTVANDRTGDTWRDAFDKSNDNFTELYGGLNSKLVTVSQESDFPNQDATSIYLDPGLTYIPLISFSHSKGIVFQGGQIRGLGKAQGVTLTYTGIGSQFSATNFNMNIQEIAISASSGSHYSFTNTGNSGIVLRAITSTGAVSQGTITGATSINIDRYTLQAATGTSGFLYAGSSGVILIQTSVTIGAPSGYISHDLGSATFLGVKFDQFFQDTVTFGNNAGSVAVAGLINSGNVNTGDLLTVDTCNFTGLTSSFTNISPSDVRWDFMNSPPFSNSSKEADVFLTSSQTVTIGSAGVFVAINGTNWLSDIAERFTTTTAGVITFIGERDAKFLVSSACTVEKSGGGADELSVGISLNDVVTGNSFTKTLSTTQNSTPTSVPVFRLVSLSQNDTIQLYVANITFATDIIVSKANVSITEVR